MESFHRPGHKFVTALAMSGLAALALGTITAAAKGTPANHAATPGAGKANTSTDQLAATTPAKYRIVSSGPLSSPAGTQSAGSVACPVVSGVQTKPTGGGVFITSTSLGANVNSSIPAGNFWDAWVNNNTSSDTTFTVYAICAKPKLTYNVVTAQATVPAHTAVTGPFAECPHGQKVTGGGVFVSSTDLAANINQSNPQGTSQWLGLINNGSSSPTTVTAYAICEKYGLKAGYSVVESPSVSAPAGTQQFASASCPVVNGVQTSVLGGGESNSSTSLDFNINSIWPNSGTSYGTWVNNGSGSAATFNAWAICASK